MRPISPDRDLDERPISPRRQDRHREVLRSSTGLWLHPKRGSGREEKERTTPKGRKQGTIPFGRLADGWLVDKSREKPANQWTVESFVGFRVLRSSEECKIV